MNLFRIGTMAAAVALVGLLAGGVTLAQEKKVKVGDKAPAFQSTDDQGKTWKSSDHVGKSVLVLYFYPADFTGGCTAQACGYRDAIESLSSKGVEVVGVSADSPKTHEMFKAFHKLNFTLLSDEKGELAHTFGVPFKAGKGKAQGKDSAGKAVEEVDARRNHPSLDGRHRQERQHRGDRRGRQGGRGPEADRRGREQAREGRLDPGQSESKKRRSGCVSTASVFIFWRRRHRHRRLHRKSGDPASFSARTAMAHN